MAGRRTSRRNGRTTTRRILSIATRPSAETHVFWHDAFKQALPDYKVTIKEVLLGDDHATVIYNSSGTLKKPIVLLPPECNGFGVFMTHGDVVKLQAGDKYLVFQRGEDGHFDMSPMPMMPDTLVGKFLAVVTAVCVIKVDSDGLMTEATEYYDRLPMMMASGGTF